MVSIVMPVYNEADIIAATVGEWCAEVTARLPGSELILVDDCSTDGTAKVLAGLAENYPCLRVLRPAKNGGHGRALRFGFPQATQDFVFQSDSDRQHLPGEFWKVWELRDTCDFVFGVRSTREDGAFREFITGSLRLLNFLIWGLWIADANCPFKLMRREPLQAVLAKVPEDSFIPMVMVSILARKMGFRVREVNVTHLPRRGGQQSLKGLLKWSRVSWRCAAQLARLRLSV
jgi:dolichol-phosphate mannosyltransferase